VQAVLDVPAVLRRRSSSWGPVWSAPSKAGAGHLA